MSTDPKPMEIRYPRPRPLLLREVQALVARAERERDELAAFVGDAPACDYCPGGGDQHKLGCASRQRPRLPVSYDERAPMDPESLAELRRDHDYWRARAARTERERDDLASLVGNAIVRTTLAPGERAAGPAHALTAAVDELRARAERAEASAKDWEDFANLP